MTQQSYLEQYQAHLQTAQAALERAAAAYLPERSEVCRAARYSLLGGGKRVRAILVLAVSALLGGDMAAAADFSAAVEMLHCYSLIHDDLPCMDNDDYRRGRPSCHKAFGEATALLAGDVLLTEAFETVGKAPATAETRARAAAALAEGAGSRGMIYGQELDLRFEAGRPTEADLRLLHRNKTGALINAAVQMGAACALADEQTCRLLEAYAFDLGLVFQIVDDVLDVTSTSEALGKPVGSDAGNGKVTFATLYGPEGAMRLAEQCNTENCSRMQKAFGPRADFLIRLAQALLVRKN